MRKIVMAAFGSLRALATILPFTFTAASIGTGAQGTPGAGAAWQNALETNTVSAYSSFILNHAESAYTDEAFCRLYQLDSETANETVQTLESEYPALSVNFDSCATTSSASLFNI